MGTHYAGSVKEVRALDVYIKLLRCTRELESRLQRQLAAHGMNIPQLAVLEALMHLGPLSQRALGRKMLRSGGSVTSLVDHLQEKGLVQRERNEDDRRSVTVRLTASGSRLIRRVFPKHANDVSEAFRCLTAREQEQLGRLCKKLGLALAQSEPE